MIPPRQQIIHQICVTSVCWPKTEKGELSACSNCTRLLGHEKKRYVMTPDQFRLCATVARDFVYSSPPCPQGRRLKVIGIFGGEPLMSPYFGEYVDILCELIPEPEHRGLWTSVDWRGYKGRYGEAAPLVEKVLGLNTGIPKTGFLNWNMHEEANRCEHHPILDAIQDTITDKKHMWELINQCWLNRDWSAAYALNYNSEPRFYFCEIASSFDRVFNLGTGLPVEPGVWNWDLELRPNSSGILEPHGMYSEQIKRTCTRCGQAMPLKKGRRDNELKDDVSKTNWRPLQIANSPMMERHDCLLAEHNEYDESSERPTYLPGQYIKEGVIRSSRVHK